MMLSWVIQPPLLSPQARNFLQQPLLGKTAYAALHFLELHGM
jgi:hypothetical protein